MKFVIWILVAALIIAHHDFWNWEDGQILFGFMPIGLVYHVGISIAAAVVWAFACTFAWPQSVDQFDDQPIGSQQSQQSNRANPKSDSAVDGGQA